MRKWKNVEVKERKSRETDENREEHRNCEKEGRVKKNAERSRDELESKLRNWMVPFLY